MRTTKGGDFLTQLTWHPRLFPVNCYLVRENDGLTLIDTGMAGSANEILVAAKATGLPITRIILTHAHGDHVGSLDALHAALPRAEVAISGRDARLLAGDRSLDAGEPSTKLRGQLIKVTTVPTRLLSGGERIGSLEVVAAPGHTPGHIALLDRRDNTLIAGDAMQIAGGIAVAGTIRPLFPWPGMATWHAPTALQSARTLLALRPSRLAVGHGDILEKPQVAMKVAVETSARRFGGPLTHAL